MTKEQMLDYLYGREAGVGCMGDYEEDEQRWQQLLDLADLALVDVAVDILLSQPLSFLTTGVECDLTEIVEAAAQKDRVACREKIVPYLDHPVAGYVFISVVRKLGMAEALPWLVPLVDKAATLNWLMVEEVAGALESIGGTEAEALLKKLRASMPQAPPGS